MDALELSIIIVDYKSQTFSLPLITDLRKQLKGIKFEIIVVDNYPDGNADDEFRKAFDADKRVKIIKAEKYNGYGSGNNLGAKEAGGKYLLLLNPDTKICDEAIEKMLDFLAKHGEIGALSPLIMQADGKNLQRDFFANYQRLTGITVKRWNEKNAKIDKSGDFFYVDMVTGASLLIRREIYQKIDGFDENFFMYIEDDDFCRRVAKLGYRNAVLKTAKIIHLEGKSSTPFARKKYYYKSQNYYWQKHYGRFQTILMKIIRWPYVLYQKVKNML